MYKSFSYYYDKMMSNINYEYFVDIVKNEVSTELNIIDIGCGTGNISIPLKKLGYNICGVDNSSEMLMIFEEKLRDENIAIPLFENDIEEELPSEAFDCAIAFLDVINYVDYKKVFNVIYDTLRVGGVFIFDVHQVSYAQELDGYFEEEEYPDFRYEWNVKVSADLEIVHDLKIIDKYDNIYHEVHHQKTYDKNIYVNYLESIGFEVEILDYTDDAKVFIKATKK